ncbi:hypothetical protein TL16_g05485 [Triparma laevis f. inornata]|uniref:Nuclear pore protein n=1 Tax=Triparma laevis f. inornata TaxID=1714386 RepID=A0A9W7EAA1_9STRA|nr:hypothetical protein TL16_g05485 [Triparma laevis f. inornata]
MSFSSLLASSQNHLSTDTGNSLTGNSLTYTLSELSSLPSTSSQFSVDGAYRLLSTGGFDAGKFEEGIAEMDVGSRTMEVNLESFLSSRHSTFINFSLKRSSELSSKTASNLTSSSRSSSWSSEKKRLQTSLLGSRTYQNPYNSTTSPLPPSTPALPNTSTWSHNQSFPGSLTPSTSISTSGTPFQKALWAPSRTLDAASHSHYRYTILQETETRVDEEQGFLDLLSILQKIDPSNLASTTLTWLIEQQKEVITQFIKQKITSGSTITNSDLSEYCEAHGIKKWGKVWLALRSGFVGEAIEEVEGMEEREGRVVERLRTGRGAVGLGSGEDGFRRLVGKLLDFQEILGDDPGIENTEDYVFSKLHRLTRGGTLRKGPADLRSLKEEIKSWGLKHFGNVWSYALPVFCSGAYEEGISVVKEHDERGAARAVTLAIVAGRRKLIDSEFMEEIIVQYCRSIEGVSPRVAMDYLGELRRERRKEHVKKLLLSTRAYTELAGVVGDDGERMASEGQSTPIDLLFGQGEVRDILRECGDALGREGGGGTDAAELYAMAGEYGRVIEVVNKELAVRIDSFKNGVEDPQRNYWKMAAYNFAEKHLNQGRTHVIERLEREDNLKAGSTFQLLMNLTAFFDKFMEGKFGESWTVLDSLGLLPRTAGEVSNCVDNFFALDKVARDCMDRVVVAGMECLFNLHASLKQDKSQVATNQQGTAGGQSLAQQANIDHDKAMRDIRDRGRLIVTYAGLLHGSMGGEVAKMIARMEAYMM